MRENHFQLLVDGDKKQLINLNNVARAQIRQRADGLKVDVWFVGNEDEDKCTQYSGKMADQLQKAILGICSPETPPKS